MKALAYSQAKRETSSKPKPFRNFARRAKSAFSKYFGIAALGLALTFGSSCAIPAATTVPRPTRMGLSECSFMAEHNFPKFPIKSLKAMSEAIDIDTVFGFREEEDQSIGKPARSTAQTTYFGNKEIKIEVSFSRSKQISIFRVTTWTQGKTDLRTYDFSETLDVLANIYKCTQYLGLKMQDVNLIVRKYNWYEAGKDPELFVFIIPSIKGVPIYRPYNALLFARILLSDPSKTGFAIFLLE